MKMKPAPLSASIVLFAALAAWPCAVHAQVAGAPGFVDYQGTVFDGTTGAPLGSTGTAPNFTASATNYTMEFRIFDQQEEGELIWAETQTVTVSLGNFSVRLGSGVAIPGLSPAPTQTSIVNAFNDKERYLELTVVIPPAASGTPITPRLAFQSSPFSFVAQRAKLADEVVGKVTATAGSTFTGTGAAPTTFVGPVSATSGIAATTGSFSGSVSASSFAGNGTIPLGGIIMWSGSTSNIPAGWALCNGANGTPNLRDRFIVGAGSSYGPGATGGLNTVQLTTSQMPSHNHSVSVSSAGNHNHVIRTDTGGGGAYGGSYSPGMIQANAIFPATANAQGASDFAGNHSHSASAGFSGGNGSHENRPPYYALAFIMRVQ